MPVNLDFPTGKNFFGDLNFQIIEANQFLEAFASNLRLNAPARVAKGKSCIWLFCVQMCTRGAVGRHFNNKELENLLLCHSTNT